MSPRAARDPRSVARLSKCIVSCNPTATLDRPAEPGTTLDQLFDRGDHFAVLHVAVPRLEERPDDANLALAVCRSMIALGLLGPAREMLAEGGGPLADMPEFRSLHQQISRAPSGRLPEGLLRTRLERNIEKLYARHPDLRRHDDVFRSVPSQFEAYQAVDGNVLACTRTSAGGRRWQRPIIDARKLAQDTTLPHDPRTLFCPPYVIAHDPSGHLLRRVFDATHQLFMTFSPRIYVVEPDPLLFGLTLCTAESVEAYCHERTSLFVGPDCLEALLGLLGRDTRRLVPVFVVGVPTGERDIQNRISSALAEAYESRERSARVTMQSTKFHYDSLSKDHWIERFAQTRDGGLRVIGLASRFTTVLQYVMRDLQAAFESLGHEFRIVMEENEHDPMPPIGYGRVVEAFKPDLIFHIDHLRAEFRNAFPANVPYVAWLQDSLPNLTRVEAGRSMGPLDFYIAPSITDFVRVYDYPESQGMVWTMAANDVVYSAEPMDELDLAPHRCDFSYVSNQSRTPESLRDERLGLCVETPLGQRLAEYLYDAMCNDIKLDPRCGGTGPAMLLLDRAERDIACKPASEQQLEAIVRSYIHPLSELLFRQRTLEWVADYCDRTGRTLNIYGQGWESHPRLAAYARGVAENGHELRAIYQASKINLQITSYGAIHQRLLDGLSAGGFFLMRFCPNDVLHEPVRRLLTAIDEDGIQPDTLYENEAGPRVAAAMAKLPNIWTGGQAVGPGQFLIPQGELNRYREYASTGYCRVAGAVFEAYDQLAFGSSEEFAAAADRFLDDADARAQVVAEARPVVLQRYSYSGLVGQLLEFVESRLADAG